MNDNGLSNNDGTTSPDPAGQESAQDALEALRREVEDHWNKYLRTAAELDNLRKRSAREIETARRFGAERLAQALLPVRDSLEAALAASDKSDPATLIQGQEATLRLLDEALAAAGVTEVAAHGEPFDPNKHEALSLLPAGDAAPNSVLEVIQKGYEMNDRLLRAAKVIVARPEDGN
jgi:molecular chaperone GrpE